MENVSSIKLNPDSKPNDRVRSSQPYKFLKSAASSSKLMLLRRLANHAYLVLERPDSLSLSTKDSKNEEGKEAFVAELLQMGGKLALLDRLLQNLIGNGHKVRNHQLNFIRLRKEILYKGPSSMSILSLIDKV